MSTPREPHVDRLVDDYLHDLLDPEEAARVEQHCADCPVCGRALDLARRRLGLLQALPGREPGDRLVRTTLDGIERHERQQRALRRRLTLGAVGSLAAGVLVLASLHAYYANLTPSGYDVVVLGQRQLMAATTASLRVRVVDRTSGRAAVPGVPVRLELLSSNGREKELASFVTDEEGGGSPRFELPDWPDGNYQMRVVASTPSGSETLWQPVELKRSWRLMLSSDKPVYQPGQTIQVRALALRKPDLKPVASRPAVFTLADPKGNILFKHSPATSAFGIASASCELAQEIEEGAYTLACKVGDTQSKLTVEVRRYTLPRFKLEVRPDRPYYAPGELVRLTVQADYFFGKPVAGGDVEVRVRARDAGERVLKTLSGKTDDKGKCELRYRLPLELVGTPKDGGARIGFQATISDSAGQKQSTLTQRLVTTRPVRIDALPEGGSLVRGVTNRVYLLVTRVDGEPVRGARVDVRGDVQVEARTDERGAATFEITPQAAAVSWTIAVRAGDTVLARRHDRVACGPPLGDFLVRPDRAVYRAGQSMTLTALGGGVEPVFVDFIKDGQTLLSETVEMHNGKGEHTFDLPADLFGTIELVAYRFGAEGLPVRRSRIVYVRPAEGLKIDVQLDRDEYRPGREAQLRLALKDAQGKPVPGAISLAAVDEAVFAVLAQRPGMEQAFYTLEEELLKPVYAIYPWMPGDEKAVRRDTGLFAATARRQDSNSTQMGMRGPELAATGRHTLAVASFPAKVQQIEQLRARRLSAVWFGWAALGAAALLLVYAALWLYLPWQQVLLIHGIGLVALLLLLLGAAFMFLMEKAAPGSRSMAMTEADFARQTTGGKAKSAPAPMPGRGGPPNDAGPPGTKNPDQAAPPRVRSYFPETLLWKPELITDDQGHLPPLTIHLADSITTWRLSASAVSADGRLGATQRPMKVFQPFFVDLDLPVHLTRGDEVGVPVVVYNYLDKPQTVKLTLTEGKWFTLSGPAEQTIELAPGEVRSTRYTVKVQRVGSHPFKVTAQSGAVGDPIEREVDVVPDGRKVEAAHSGSLDRPATHTLEVPAEVIEGSVKAFVKLYPSSFSQVVEGLDSIFRMPYGCFEQTSSTTYPNVLALHYLRSTKQSAPQVEARARQYIHLGYQRLVGFEVPGGGFDWFGRPPANRTLTAYGLMEFEDMAKVHDVDPNLIARTRSWLLAQRKADGTWEPDGQRLHEDPAGRDAKLARLGATAYIAWAVFGDGKTGTPAGPTLDYLLSHEPPTIGNDHVLALVCHALLSIDPTGKEAGEYVQELLRRAKKSEDGKHAWWEPPAGRRTLFYAGGDSARIETTALAALALLRARAQGQQTRPALAWLVTKKDPHGTWHSTQATVLSLKALLAGTGKALGGDSARVVELRVGQHSERITIPADQAEVMKLVDVSRHLRPGRNEVSLTEKSTTAAGYQVVFRYHVPGEKEKKKEPLTIRIGYDRTDLAVGETVKATATVTNEMKTTAPMVMLDLPVPPGFAADTASFAALVQKGTIARYQARPRSVLVYLRGLEPGQPLTLTYSLQATMPVKATAGVARVYEYYDPQKEGTSPARRFTVRARP